MSTTLEKPARPREPMNGVDVPKLFATLDVVKAQPELAKFQFRAVNRWQLGTHSRTRIQSFSGAGGEHEHQREFVYDADHPEVLVARDNAPTPVEFLLHALASCITAGLGTIASARGITLYEVESTLEGDIDLLGTLGIDKDVRNGYQGIRVDVKIRGDAPPDVLRALVERSRDRSAVYDVITRGVPVELSIRTS